MPDLLVRGRWVIPGAWDPVVSDGAVVVRDGRVAAIGAFDELRAACPDAVLEGGPDVAVIPGFIAAHHHANGATALQQGIGDDILELWLLAMRTARSLDPELRGLLTSARLLRNGVTAAIEMTELHAPPGPAAASLGRRLDAYDRAGIRMAVAVGLISRGSLVPDEDLEGFLASVPPEERDFAAAAAASPAPMSEDEYLGVVADARGRLIDRSSGGRVDVWYGPPAPHWVSPHLLERIGLLSEEGGARIQIHVSESLAEGRYGPRVLGVPMARYLERTGLLNGRCSFAHGVWLDDEELGILARTGTAVAHNASSNLRLRAGVARLTAMLDAGVTVGIGLDANGLADDDDPFSELRLALRLARRPQPAERAPSLEEVVDAATVGGARILGRPDDLGRLAPGSSADLVTVDLARATWPWTAPEADPRALVYLRATGDDVRTVMVEGEVVVRDRRPVRFDLDAVVAESASRLSATDVDAVTRALVKRLRPHLERWLRHETG